jgi:hypothetical protein
MHVAIILGMGAALGAVSGAGIFFADGEPYKIEIFIAATLKGIFISFVTAISLHAPFFVWQTALVGAIYASSSHWWSFLPRGHGVQRMPLTFSRAASSQEDLSAFWLRFSPPRREEQSPA